MSEHDPHQRITELTLEVRELKARLHYLTKILGKEAARRHELEQKLQRALYRPLGHDEMEDL